MADLTENGFNEEGVQKTAEALLERLTNLADTRAEMQKTYKDALGYDPTTVYDAKELKTIFDKIVNTSGESITASTEDSILSAAFEDYNNSREKNQLYSLKRAMLDYGVKPSMVNAVNMLISDAGTIKKEKEVYVPAVPTTEVSWDDDTEDEEDLTTNFIEDDDDVDMVAIDDLVKSTIFDEDDD